MRTLAHISWNMPLHRGINSKGLTEQQDAHTFPQTYGGHKLNRNFIGYMLHFDREYRLGKFNTFPKDYRYNKKGIIQLWD